MYLLENFQCAVVGKAFVFEMTEKCCLNFLLNKMLCVLKLKLLVMSNITKNSCLVQNQMLTEKNF